MKEKESHDLTLACQHACQRAWILQEKRGGTYITHSAKARVIGGAIAAMSYVSTNPEVIEMMIALENMLDDDGMAGLGGIEYYDQKGNRITKEEADAITRHSNDEP